MLLFFSWKGERIGRLAIIASIATALWAGLSALPVGYNIPIPGLLPFVELARSSLWCLFLLNTIGSFSYKPIIKTFNATPFHLFQLIIAVTAAIILLGIFNSNEGIRTFCRESLLVLWVSFAIIGLLLIEHLFRNADVSQRWAIKYLCLGIGSIFAYDFFMFADALLFKQLNPDLWRARGLVNGFMVPLIAISIARNPNWSLNIHVSRHVVFHSATFLGAGGYLLAMATVGYYIKFYGGSWGSTLQIAFSAGTGALLLILLFSGSIRAKIRVLLSKHFFSYKYDYRTEWQEFTETLAKENKEIPERTILALSAVVDSNGGDLWLRQKQSGYELAAQLNMPEPLKSRIAENDSLIQFMRLKQWLIDLDEYCESPDIYEDLTIPDWFFGSSNAWLIVPLIFGEDLLGFIVIKRPSTHRSINWEDRDLLKMAGQQAATHLAQHQADLALSQAKQFEAFNRLSAYVVHDLKNILAQQSLIVSNAEKHKHNPLFVDDVLRTIENSVGRMTRLMEQMKSGLRGADHTQKIELNHALQEVVKSRSKQTPTPGLELSSSDIVVSTNREELFTVLGHIIQNAQDATPKDGKVTVRLSCDNQRAVIEVEDTGSGMDPDFVKHRLFRPFDSTKGLTGMGIGAFESREFIRSQKGNISVISALDKGSLFKITLPLMQQQHEDNSQLQ